MAGWGNYPNRHLSDSLFECYFIVENDTAFRISSFIYRGCFFFLRKKITFRPNGSEPLLVVEASIANDQAPVVILSQSLNYFSQISAGQLANSFVHNADITISNG